MRKTSKIVSIIGLMSLSNVALAAGPGCGWGAMLFENKDGTMSHVFAATTNGTSGNQTFGMTSGTAGCDTSEPITLAALDQYLDSNLDKVAYDMSRGGGEALESLASIMQIDEQDQGVFFSTSKEHFQEIFSRDDVTRAEVVTALLDVMGRNDKLAKYVPAA